jgi:acetylornithine deacetylase/succinyl-diaminopimelate desuccinylase-like protein
MEVDLRSSRTGNLDDLDAHFRRSISDASSAGNVECKIELMGERPSGITPASAPVVQAAMEVTRCLGVEPQLDIGSTDANIPSSMGIPGIAIGAGGNCGNVHTFDEWFDPTHRELGVQRLVAVVAVLAGLQD